MSHEVTVRWTGNRQFVGRDEDGHGIIMDVPVDKGGENAGASPLKLVLYSLAGCTSVDIVGILQKKRQPLNGLQVNIVGEQGPPNNPRPYETITLEYVIDGEVAPKAIEDAIMLSSEKYCSVKAMMADTVKISSTWRYAKDVESDVE